MGKLFSTILLFMGYALIGAIVEPTNECMSRDFGYGSNVCVCSNSFCDYVKPVEPLLSGEAVIFTSTKSGSRLQRSTSKWRFHEHENDIYSDKTNNSLNDDEYVEVLKVDPSKQYQKLDGFGGAFTDAAGINIASLPESAQDHLLRSYFSPQGGIRYNIARIPIASCDFSTSNYSYDDVADDFDLLNFVLAKEDMKYKIPFIKKAILLSKETLKLFGSPWSSPSWMKTNGMMQNGGTLLGQPGGKHYKAFAKYLVKFIEEYEKRGVDIWSLTVENEPSAGYDNTYAFQSLGFTAKLQRDFIKYDLGPALEGAGKGHIKLMILDDQRYMIVEWATLLLNDPNVAKYVSHVALHWYSNKLTPIEILNIVHNQFPNTAIIGTEACSGFVDNRVFLGDWNRAEDYAEDIIQNLNHWYTGWIDWNLALDQNGGPNWVRNFVDSPIIVNATSGEFYKQPMFYAMGHFSTFLPRDSIRIKLTVLWKRKNVMATAFSTVNGYKVVILLNRNNFPVKIMIKQVNTSLFRPHELSVTMEPHSIKTVLWK